MVTALVLMIGALGAITTVLNTLDDSTQGVTSVACEEAADSKCERTGKEEVNPPAVCSDGAGGDNGKISCG